MQSTNYNNDPEAIKAEVDSIKESIKDILKRLTNLKGEALRVLYKNSDELRSVLREIKNKIMQHNEQRSLDNVCSYIERNPVKSALCCFASGVILAFLIKK